MSRLQRKAHMTEVRKFVQSLPETLTPVHKSEWPPATYFKYSSYPVNVWRSRKYIVQMYAEQNTDHPGLIRLSINRVITRPDGDWADGLSWDEIQSIKRELGFAEWYGIEVFPRDSDVINVASIRHLWLLEKPLTIGWFNS